MNDEQVVQLKALADETRLKILIFLKEAIPECCLTEQGVCQCDLQQHLGLSQATISHHLKILHTAQLICTSRVGKWSYYHLNTASMQALSRVFDHFAKGENHAKPCLT